MAIATRKTRVDDLWRTATCPGYLLTSLGQQLVAINYTKIFVYSPFTHSWVYAMDTPVVDGYPSHAVPVPSEGQIVIYARHNRGYSMIIKALFRGEHLLLHGHSITVSLAIA